MVMNVLRRLCGQRTSGLESGAERRASERTTTRVPAEVVAENGRRIRVLIVDTSPGGLQLSVDSLDAMPAILDGVLHIQSVSPFAEGPESTLNARGEIRYARKGAGGEARIGLKLEQNNGPPLDHQSTLALSPEWDAQVRRLTEQLHLELPSESCRVVVLASASPGEGVTTIAQSFSMALARDERRRVLYVDADFARPAGTGDAPDAHGSLIEMAQHGLPPEAVVRQTALKNLQILGGRTNSEALLRLSEIDLKRAIDALRSRYEYVVIDAAATIVSPFSFVLARNADGVFLIVSLGISARDSLLRAIEQLNRYGGRLLGVVVNQTAS